MLRGKALRRTVRLCSTLHMRVLTCHHRDKDMASKIENWQKLHVMERLAVCKDNPRNCIGKTEEREKNPVLS